MPITVSSPRPAAAHPPQPQGRQPGQEMLAELMQTQRQLTQALVESRELRSKLSRRSHQMSVLQHVSEILAATGKEGQVASVVLDVLVQEFHCKRGGVWVLEHRGSTYQPMETVGLPAGAAPNLVLPAPNPFLDHPLVLHQPQWLDPHHLPASLRPLVAGQDLQLYYVPFEHQLLLLGFAVLAMPNGHQWPEEDQDSLSLLQRQTAVSLYNAWLFKDLSQQRDALQRQALELERVNAQIKEADQLKSEFLALTSHELRTPLTGILGFTKLVIDGLYESEDEMRHMLQDSYASGQHLLSLLNDILDLAKIESGRMEVKVEPFSLPVLIEEVKPIAEAYPRNDTVSLIWPAFEDEIPEIMVDPGRLKQVLLNLLSNALKFTKDGYVALRVERGVGVVTISVVDSGIGVSLEGQKRLFQKFAQAEGGHAREFGGTGLGLVICKHLMELMGGSISLYSEGQGFGSTLSITVKIA
ncbi:MAG TPA: ATP-binding protein [Holophagaceae bacterium]|nr:ATP-binding protein [Holophagaceae bacterium]